MNTHLYRYGQLSPALKFYNAIGWTTGDKEKYRKKKQDELQYQGQKFLKRPTQQIVNINDKLKKSYKKGHFEAQRFNHLRTLKEIRNNPDRDSISSHGGTDDEDFNVKEATPKRGRNNKMKDGRRGRGRGRRPKNASSQQKQSEVQYKKKPGRPKKKESNKKMKESSQQDISSQQSNQSSQEKKGKKQVKGKKKQSSEKSSLSSPHSQQQVQQKANTPKNSNSSAEKIIKRSQVSARIEAKQQVKPFREKKLMIKSSQSDISDLSSGQQQENAPSPQQQKAVSQKWSSISSSENKINQQIQQQIPQQSESPSKLLKDVQKAPQVESYQRQVKMSIYKNKKVTKRINPNLQEKQESQKAQEKQIQSKILQKEIVFEKQSNMPNETKLVEKVKKRGRKSKAQLAEMQRQLEESQANLQPMQSEQRIQSLVQQQKEHSKFDYKIIQSQPIPKIEPVKQKQEQKGIQVQIKQDLIKQSIQQQETIIYRSLPPTKEQQAQIIKKHMDEKAAKLAISSRTTLESLQYFDTLSKEDKQLFKQWKQQHTTKRVVAQSSNDQQLQYTYVKRKPRHRQKVRRYKKIIIAQSDSDGIDSSSEMISQKIIRKVKKDKKSSEGRYQRQRQIKKKSKRQRHERYSGEQGQRQQ